MSWIQLLMSVSNGVEDYDIVITIMTVVYSEWPSKAYMHTRCDIQLGALPVAIYLGRIKHDDDDDEFSVRFDYLLTSSSVAFVLL